MQHRVDINWQTVTPEAPADRRAASEILHHALIRNSAMDRFIEAADQAGHRILLLVNDGHRATKTRQALAALADLISRRSPSPRFEAIISTGTHRFESEERRRFETDTFGDSGLKVERVIWHDANDAQSLVAIGKVRMNRLLADNRFLLPIGSVEPHYFAGFTGPHKTVTIGCMASGDIERNHAHAMDPESQILRLGGNPVHQGVVHVLQLLKSAGKTVCAIAEVNCGDTACAAAVGDPLDVLDELLPTVRKIYVKQLPNEVDVLQLTVPMPLGRNLYQAEKALKNNHLAVRDGGGILLQADCPEGVGPDAYMDLLRRAGDYTTARRIVEREGYRLGDHKAVKLRHLTDPDQRGVHVALVSRNISSQDAATAGMTLFPDSQSALEWLTSVIDHPIRQGVIVHDAGVVTLTPAESAPKERCD